MLFPWFVCCFSFGWIEHGCVSQGTWCLPCVCVCVSLHVFWRSALDSLTNLFVVCIKDREPPVRLETAFRQGPLQNNRSLSCIFCYRTTLTTVAGRKPCTTEDVTLNLPSMYNGLPSQSNWQCLAGAGKPCQTQNQAQWGMLQNGDSQDSRFRGCNSETVSYVGKRTSLPTLANMELS